MCEQVQGGNKIDMSGGAVGLNCLHVAVYSGKTRPESVKDLLAAGTRDMIWDRVEISDLVTFGLRALHIAILNEDHDTAEILSKEMSSQVRDGKTLHMSAGTRDGPLSYLHVAAAGGNMAKLVKALLEEKAVCETIWDRVEPQPLYSI